MSRYKAYEVVRNEVSWSGRITAGAAFGLMYAAMTLARRSASARRRRRTNGTQ